MFGYAHPVDLVGQPVMRYSAPEHREMIGHMTHITRLGLLKDLAIGGVETPDLRRSSEPPPGGDLAGGKGETT